MNIKNLRDENKALKAELRNTRKEMDVLAQISGLFSASSDMSRNFTAVMKKVKAATGSGAWSLQLVDEPFLKTIALKSSGNIRKLRSRSGSGVLSLVLKKGAPLVVHDVSKDKRFHRQTDGFKNVKIRSLLCVPLKVKGRIVGVLRLINKTGGGRFTDTDRRFLSDAAYFAGIAMERTYLYKRIEEISITDDLTSLYNLRFLHQYIDIEIERSRRYGSLFSLIFMDIDNFKKVNDRFGHLTGSKALVEISTVLKKNLRKVDIITRYGGDEFVIILPQTSSESGLQVAERLRKIIEKYVFMKKENPVRLTASLGVASFPDNAGNRETLLRIADNAMYRGKFSTKNVVFAAK
ncbi:MAG: sensor domain-containing diguanylate cyclase [Nitrospiraceae bacterium]|nr:MAG: sensor domain-containing diguanylate cyclase [Nitrospiraceae bacterium]